MSYQQTIERLTGDPEGLERAYRAAIRAGDEAAFAEAIEVGYAQAPDNMLLAAWHYRLNGTTARVKGRVVAWAWALPLGILNGLLLWFLSDYERFRIRIANPLTGELHDFLPLVLLLAAPISAAAIALFLAVAGFGPLAGGGRWQRLLAVSLGLAAGTAYVLLLSGGIWPRLFQEQYLGLMALHLAVLGWAAVGFVALARGNHAGHRFAFLVKSLEAGVVAGLLAIAGGLFTAITFGLFSALGIEPPEWVMRLFSAGGGGLIAVVAVALVYDPRVAPARQSFDEGLSKLVALLMRLLLPLTVGVLLVYLAFIPFNWREPFENRDVLLIFNAMLFAVVALIVGATPVTSGDSDGAGSELGARGQAWLRRGMMALAALALLVSLYALAAILYRTANGRLTPNRLLFIGWNLANIAILVVLLVGQVRAGRARWLAGLHRTFSFGIGLYLVWAVAGLLLPPIVFRGHAADVASLPESIQALVYERADPILLKCPASPHIYLLEDGKKRWVRDIPTFEAEGYVWGDVAAYLPCADIRAVPDGETIPPGSGPPPRP